jgi:hypothetical protein
MKASPRYNSEMIEFKIGLDFQAWMQACRNSMGTRARRNIQELRRTKTCPKRQCNPVTPIIERSGSAHCGRFRAAVARTLLGSVALVFLCVSLGSLSAQASSSGPNPPQVVLPESSFDFGEAFKGETLNHAFMVRNMGGSALELSEATASSSKKSSADCGCHGNGVTLDRSVQPGGSGLIRVRLDTAVESGKVERNIVIHTNDPAHPTIKLTILAAIQPPPDWLSRSQNNRNLDGERVAGLRVWPTAHPQIRLAKGESLKISLRVTSSGSQLAPDAAADRADGPGVASNGAVTPQYAVGPEGAQAMGRGGNGGNGGNGSNRVDSAPTGSAVPLSVKRATYHIRRDTSPGSPDTFRASWIDIDLGPMPDAGLFSYSLVIPANNGKLSGLVVDVTISVIEDELVVAPSSLNLTDLQLPGKPGDAIRIGALGVRSALRTFHIIGLSSTLAFMKLEQQTIVDGRHYMIKVRVAAGAAPRPGTYEGSIRISTDDKIQPTILVPCEITLVQ